jgi:hypothetical protein
MFYTIAFSDQVLSSIFSLGDLSGDKFLSHNHRIITIGKGSVQWPTVTKRKLKQQWSTIPPISTKRTITSDLNSLSKTYRTGDLVISHRVICYLQSAYSKDNDLCLVVIHYMSLFLWLRLGVLWSVIMLCYLQSGYSKDKDLCLVVIHYMSLFLWLRLGILWSVIVLYVTFSLDIVKTRIFVW